MLALIVLVLIVFVAILIAMKGKSSLSKRELGDKSEISSIPQKKKKTVRFSPEKSERVYSKGTGAIVEDNVTKSI